jgi:UDP-2-acetamido-2-deoxy-ribo-hexuluronate aminotransferase
MVQNLDFNRQFAAIESDVRRAIETCLAHQKWILGPEVTQFESLFSQRTGSRHSIGVSSGTEALVLGLRAIAIKKFGREFFDRTHKVITTPFTFTATGGAILRSGATPLFVDIERATFNVDIDQIHRALREHKDVVAILPVHLYGLPCAMGDIIELAKRYNVEVLEDCAQAFGAQFGDASVGTFGTIGAFSFFPSKTLGAFGDAGLCTTQDDGYAEILRMLLKHGGKDKYNAIHIGYNARLDTLQAAILVAKLKYFKDWLARRQAIATYYSNSLASCDKVVIPTGLTSASHAYHQYTIRVDSRERDSLVRYLAEREIGSMVYYPIPLHHMELFKERCLVSGVLKHAEEAAKEVVSLPIDPLLQFTEVDAVIDAVKSFYNH